MEATVTPVDTEGKVWGGGNQPLNASYGKMMMWFFIVSDALTFSGFLAAYGFSRFKFMDTWPIADEVFTHFPLMHGQKLPMYYVALMTFILIMSSVTMVLAVDAGHKLKQSRVAWYMFATIVGGLAFVGSQAWEWSTFIRGEYGAVETQGGSILQFVNAKTGEQIALSEFAHHTAAAEEEDGGLWFISENSQPDYTVHEVLEGFEADANVLVRLQNLDENGQKTILNRTESLEKLEGAKYVVQGANLHRNEYGSKLFADFFFFITGFHGFHVFSGVVLNIIIFTNVIVGTYEKRKSYEMVEKVGLYWHFVDLVWVFVFTFFYLV